MADPSMREQAGVPAIRLWYAAGACSLAPHVLLHELGVPFEAIEISVARGENLTPAFARINPKMRVPVLSLDGEVITEVPAILLALSDLAPERRLLGSTALQRARAQEWMSWLAVSLHAQGFGAFWRPERFSSDPKAFDAIRTKARASIADCFEIIENRLSETGSVGDGFTAVDPFLLVFYRWGNAIGFDMSSTHPRYTAFARNLVRRDAVKAALATEGLGERALAD